MQDRMRSLTGSKLQRQSGSLLYRFEADLDLKPIGLVPEGLRMANSFDGRITRGLLKGARVWGIDHFLLLPNGVGVLDAPKTLSAGDTHVYEHVRGYCLPPAGLELPPLEALLEPGFAWPDLLFPLLGFSTFRAAAPELAYLNSAVAALEGYVNLAAGRLAVETRIIEHSGQVAGPAAAAA